MLFGTTVSRSIQRIGGFPKSNNRIENKKFELLLLGCGNCQLAKSYEWVRVPNENLKCIAGCTAGCTQPQTSEYTRKSSSGWKQAVFLFFLELDAGKETKHSHANSGLIAILRRFFSNLWGGASIGPSERYIKIIKHVQLQRTRLCSCVWISLNGRTDRFSTMVQVFGQKTRRVKFATAFEAFFDGIIMKFSRWWYHRRRRRWPAPPSRSDHHLAPWPLYAKSK